MTEANANNAKTGWLVFAIVAIVVFILGWLGASIMERRAEAKAPQLIVTPLGETESDNAVWGQNYPRQYASYQEMDDSTTRSKYGGSDPRDYLEEVPANVILFAGYGFAKDYLQGRGHVHARDDVWETARLKDGNGDHKAKAPATCWTCKSPDVPRMMAELGSPEAFYKQTFVEMAPNIEHAIGCLDCHDPKTMKLRISRPALVEAFERQGKDINAVSHQEMRTLVCAQCHVEYYFKGDSKYLTFPWDGGTAVEDMEVYYNDRDFKDWTHAISGAPMVKMQHPDYEIYLRGVHAYRNVSCADCHMPYRTEGGVKYTDHKVQSPLMNIANSCAVCHRWSEDEIRNRVTSIQDGVKHGRVKAEAALVRAHFDIAACKEAGATDEELQPVRALVRAAQVRWDYVAANNGMGFHAPQECQRVLGDAVDLAQECHAECVRLLAKKGYLGEVAYPDWSSKDKAQALMKAFIDGTPPKLLN